MISPKRYVIAWRNPFAPFNESIIMKYLFFILLIPSFSFAQKFKVRAREHFEIHTIDVNGIETKYKGLSNTLNFWWEKPYDISYGFSLSPVFSNLEAQDSPILGNDITFWNIGFELKYHFLSANKSIFVRPGIGYSLLKPDNSVEDASGYFLYTGIGYEIPFKSFGLALEFGVRYSDLSDNITVESITPSIGFHFYDMF